MTEYERKMLMQEYDKYLEDVVNYKDENEETYFENWYELSDNMIDDYTDAELIEYTDDNIELMKDISKVLDGEQSGNI